MPLPHLRHTNSIHLSRQRHTHVPAHIPPATPKSAPYRHTHPSNAHALQTHIHWYQQNTHRYTIQTNQYSVLNDIHLTNRIWLRWLLSLSIKVLCFPPCSSLGHRWKLAVLSWGPLQSLQNQPIASKETEVLTEVILKIGSSSPSQDFRWLQPNPTSSYNFIRDPESKPLVNS